MNALEVVVALSSPSWPSIAGYCAQNEKSGIINPTPSSDLSSSKPFPAPFVRVREGIEEGICKVVIDGRLPKGSGVEVGAEVDESSTGEEVVGVVCQGCREVVDSLSCTIVCDRRGLARLHSLCLGSVCLLRPCRKSGSCVSLVSEMRNARLLGEPTMQEMRMSKNATMPLTMALITLPITLTMPVRQLPIMLSW